jgi:sulfur carrier protein
MKLTVNGSMKEIDKIANVEELVHSLVETDKGLIVELNGKIIKRDHWKRQAVVEGDIVELIKFVGGG